MKDLKRAIRRHHRDRMKQKAKERLSNWGLASWIKDFDRALGIRGDTFTVCSCYGCGNPRRRFDENTMAERRRAEADKDEL